MPEIKEAQRIIFVDGGSVAVPATEFYNQYIVTGTDAMTVNWGMTLAGTPRFGMVVDIVWSAIVTPAGNTIAIFGVKMPDSLVALPQRIFCWYDTAWHVVFSGSMGSTQIIETGMLMDKLVTMAKMADLTRGSLITGQTASNRPTALAMADGNILIRNALDIVAVTPTGDVTISNTGVTTIGATRVTTGMIVLEAVGMNQMADLAQGSMITGQAANRPAALAIGDMQIPMGNGTDINALVLSGDISSLNTGHVSVLKGTYQTDAGITTGIVQCKIIPSAQLKPLLDGIVNNLVGFNANDKIISVKIHEQTASGVISTIDVGVDAVLRTAGADGDGLLTDANGNLAGVYETDNPALTYLGALLAFGTFTCDAGGFTTIQSSANLSASAIVAECKIYYLAI